MQARLQSLPCYRNGGGSNRRFTPLETRLVHEGTNFLMEEYTFRLSLLCFKDLGQLDKSVGELLLSQIEGLVQDGHLQNAHASLLQVLHGAISYLWINCQVNNIYLILHQVEDLPLE